MAGLIVEKDMRLESGQHCGFGDSAHEEGFSDRYVPDAQSAEYTFVRGRGTRGNQRGADRRAAAVGALEIVLDEGQGFQQPRERSFGQRFQRVFTLVILEGFDAPRLKDAVRFVRKIYGVAVESNTDLVQFFERVLRFLIQQRGRHAGIDRRLHVVFVQRKKQTDVECLQIRSERSAAG